MELRPLNRVSGGFKMQIELKDEEARTLRDLLHDYLPDLRREVARTDAREFRHEMEKRQAVCEMLLTRLEEATG
jgi:hypothetical protein